MKKQAQFEKFIVWYDLPLAEKDPIDIKGFAGFHKVSLVTLYKWQKAIEKERGVSDDDEIQVFMERLYKLATDQKASAKHMELFAKLKGLLIDKQEIKHKFELSADDHYRIDREADRRIQELNRGADGIQGLQEESPILLEQVCVDTEQEHSPDG